MATIGSLNVELRTNTAKFAQGMNKANGHLGVLSKGVKQLKGALGLLFVGVGFKKIIDATIEQEQAMKQLETAVKSTGAIAGFSAKELAKFAGELQKVTNFGDEAIISMQSILLTFTNLRGKILPQTTEAVLNLATRMGTDLNSAALQLGKALNDPVANLGALSRAGIQFSKDQKEVIKSLAESGRLAGAQGIILEELETQFGGAAKAARDTFGGALISLGNAAGDLLEQDSLSGAKDEIEDLTKLLQDPATVQGFNSLISSIISLTGAAAGLVSEFGNLGTQIAANLAKATGNLTRLDEIEQKIKDVDRAIKGGLSTPVGFLFYSDEALQAEKARLEHLRVLILEAQGITVTPPIITIDITKSIEDINEYNQAFEDGKSHVDAYNQIMKDAERIIENTKTPFERMTEEIERANIVYDAGKISVEQYIKAITQAQDNFDGLITKTSALDDVSQSLGLTFSSAFEDAIVEGGKLRDILKGLEQDILRIITRKLITEPIAGGISGFISDVAPSVFGGARANGGPVSAGRSFLVGERGPELFTPNQSGNITANDKMGAVSVVNNFTINAPQGSVSRESQQQIAAATGAAVNRAIRRNN